MHHFRGSRNQLHKLINITVDWFVAKFKNRYIACELIEYIVIATWYNTNDDQIQAVLSLPSAIGLILLSTLVYSVVGEGWLWKRGAYGFTQKSHDGFKCNIRVCINKGNNQYNYGGIFLDFCKTNGVQPTHSGTCTNLNPV